MAERETYDKPYEIVVVRNRLLSYSWSRSSRGKNVVRGSALTCRRAMRAALPRTILRVERVELHGFMRDSWEKRPEAKPIPSELAA